MNRALLCTCGLISILCLSACQNSSEKPIILKNDSASSVNPAAVSLYDSRTTEVTDSLLIGGFRWGMSPAEINEHLHKNKISDFFSPEKGTASTIVIGDTAINTFIEYGFDTTLSLRYIEMWFSDEQIETLQNSMTNLLGKHYLKVINSFENTYFRQVWFIGNQEYQIIHSRDRAFYDFVKLCISDTQYSGSITSYSVSFVDYLKEVYSSFGAPISITQRINTDYSEEISYNGEVFTIKDYKVKGNEVSYKLTYTEDEAREYYHPEKLYKLKQKTFVLDEPNGKKKENPTGIINSYYCMTELDEVAVYLIKGNWVKVACVPYRQNNGWMKIDAFAEVPSYINPSKTFEVHSLAREMRRTPQPQIKVDIPKMNNYSEKQNEYYKSVAREKAYKEAGLDNLAKQERQDRQRKIQSGEYRY